MGSAHSKKATANAARNRIEVGRGNHERVHNDGANGEEERACNLSKRKAIATQDTEEQQQAEEADGQGQQEGRKAQMGKGNG